MSLDMMFTLELLLVAAVIVVVLVGAIYIAVRNRRIRRETGRQVGSRARPTQVTTTKALPFRATLVPDGAAKLEVVA